MPIYEYQCVKCGRVFEELVASHKSKGQCPFCGAGNAKRLISTFAAHGTSASVPCEGDQCPGGAGAAGECAGGSCPFS